MHLVGVFLVLMPLAAVQFHVLLGGDRGHRFKRPIAVIHGIGMLLSLVGGFGLLAKLQLTAMIPGWAWLKLVLWLILGAMIGMTYRLKARAWTGWWLIFGLAALSAALGIFKP